MYDVESSCIQHSFPAIKHKHNICCDKQIQKNKHNIRCDKQIQKKIIQAEEDEVHDTKVEGFVVRDLDSLGCAFIALSSACPDLKKFTTVLT
jgi:hypothetical protein